MTTAKDFRWPEHARARALERLGWSVIPPQKVVKTEMRSYRGGSIWVGKNVALFVENGCVTTCINETMARYGHYKSPPFSPTEEFARLADPPKKCLADSQASPPCKNVDLFWCTKHHRRIHHILRENKGLRPKDIATRIGIRDVGAYLRTLKQKGHAVNELTPKGWKWFAVGPGHPAANLAGKLSPG